METIEYPDGATPLDPDELEGLKLSHIATRAEIDLLEAANISHGFIWLERKRTVEILTDSFAREFHKQLFGEVWQWAGKYRTTEKILALIPCTLALSSVILWTM